jgi:hypothetical protein
VVSNLARVTSASRDFTRDKEGWDVVLNKRYPNQRPRIKIVANVGTTHFQFSGWKEKLRG